MISAVVLAAGLSSRMAGRSKALLPIGEAEVFVTKIVRTLLAAGVPDVVVVVGHQKNDVEAAVRLVASDRVRVVENPAYVAGQFSSILAGLDAVESAAVTATLLVLVDAPLFSASTVRAVIERFEATGAPVVRAVRGAEHGHPVLIRADLFDEIRRADPSRGAKPVVRAHASEIGDVEVDDAGAFVDIDTPDDYRHFIGDLPEWQ